MGSIHGIGPLSAGFAVWRGHMGGQTKTVRHTTFGASAVCDWVGLCMPGSTGIGVSPIPGSGELYWR